MRDLQAGAVLLHAKGSIIANFNLTREPMDKADSTCVGATEPMTGMASLK
jgi:hypothetical protein